MRKIMFWRTISLFGMLASVLVSFFFGYNIGGPFAAIFAISYIVLSIITNFVRVKIRLTEHIFPIRLVEPVSMNEKIRNNTIEATMAICIAGFAIPSIIELFLGPIFSPIRVGISVFLVIFIIAILTLPFTERWALKVGKKIRDKDEIKKRKKDIPLRKV